MEKERMVSAFEHENALMHYGRVNRRSLIALVCVCVTFIVITTITRTWNPNDECALYTLRADDGIEAEIIETAGYSLAIDGAVEFTDEQASSGKLDGIEFIDEDDFRQTASEIINADGCLTSEVEIDEIASESVRDYIECVIAREINDRLNGREE